MEIGPSLGMVKSSSLESLHNVMHHHIKRDVVDDGSDLRNRSTRNSFKRAVDRSYEAGEERGGAEQSQRGVDGKIVNIKILLNSGHASQLEKNLAPVARVLFLLSSS